MRKGDHIRFNVINLLTETQAFYVIFVLQILTDVLTSTLNVLYYGLYVLY